MSTTPNESLKQITTTDLGDGGTLPREMQDEFFTEVQDESVVLDRVRIHPVGRSKTRIPKIGVGERLRQGQDENTSLRVWSHTISSAYGIVKTWLIALHRLASQGTQ